jgi:hypothetical protein
VRWGGRDVEDSEVNEGGGVEDSEVENSEVNEGGGVENSEVENSEVNEDGGVKNTFQLLFIYHQYIEILHVSSTLKNGYKFTSLTQ